MEKKKRWYTVYMARNLSNNLVCLCRPDQLCFLILGTKQTNALQQDTSKRYENLTTAFT